MSQFTNSFDVLPDFTTAVPNPQLNTHYTDDPSLPPPEDERTVIWRAIYGLGRNFDAFANRQIQEAKENRFVLEALLGSLSVGQSNTSITSSGSSAPRVREPRQFDGQASQVDPFLREITNSLFLQRRAITTDRDKCLYFGFYLLDGSPSAWYTSVEKNRPELLDDYSAFIAAFKEHFEDSDRYATALAKIRKLKQAPSSASSYASCFRELAWELSLTNQTSIQMFYDGLKDVVKDALTVAFLHDTPTDFDEYVKRVITIDNNIHRREAERQNTHTFEPHINHPSSIITSPPQLFPSSTSHPNLSNSPPPFIPETTPYVPSSSPPLHLSFDNDVIPMEIDSMKLGPVIQAELERRRAEGLCDYCGQGVHSIDTCPNMSESAKRKLCIPKS